MRDHRRPLRSTLDQPHPSAQPDPGGIPGEHDSGIGAIRFDADMLTRLRALAARRNTGYQTLLKTFVAERLYEEEKREGLVGSTTPT
jgi:hypothetical protein